jgi:hypothetical protein
VYKILENTILIGDSRSLGILTYMLAPLLYF